jgi:uncharacterized membrane protein HdeD (DUF308 family)
METYGPPWKVALIGGVAVVAGVALAVRDWSLTELVVFVAVFFVGRGALHVVTLTFEGVGGALSALLGAAEIAIGIVLLAWPSPTLLVVAAVVGGLVLVSAVVGGTVALATRAEQRWQLAFAVAVVELALGVTLIARPGGTIRGVAITLAVIAFVEAADEIATAVTRTQDHVPDSVPMRSSAPVS